jgi:hypothetical protein
MLLRPKDAGGTKIIQYLPSPLHGINGEKLHSHRICKVGPETHTKRQATQQGCRLSLLGVGDKGIEIVYDEEKIFVLGRLEQPFTSVSAVSSL